MGKMKSELPSYKVLRRKLKENKKLIKIAAGCLTVMVAILFFGANGDNYNAEDNSLELSITGYGEENSEKNDLAEAPEAPEKLEEPTIESEIFCDISGAVNNPGVYSISYDSRLNDLIIAAGGLTQDADIDVINQASHLMDGEKIYIPTKEEAESSGMTKNIIISEGSPYVSGSNSSSDADGKININTADLTELQKIPGVGPVTAEKIISYREANGTFSSTEELKNISGIGEKTYKKMENYVTI